MGGLFSSHPHARNSSQKHHGTVNEVDKAVLDLKNARDRLQRYQLKLERDSEQLVLRAAQAKQAGKTKTALHFLKIRRFKEKEVESVQQQLLNVLQMVQTVDSQQHQSAMLQALKAGKDALHQLHQETSVDDIIKLMDDLQEEGELEQEINDVFRQGVSTLSAQDEADVEAELEALIGKESAATLPDLPQVPTNKLPELVEPTPAVASTTFERIAVPS